MIYKNQLIRIAIVVFMTGCIAATGNNGKKTVSRNATTYDAAAEYPSSLYLTATGIGQTEREAKRLAVAELSNIFEARVTSDVSSSVQSVIGSDSEERITKAARQSVRVVSDLKLKGVRVEKVWYDESQRSHYALAVLNRRQAKDDWLQELHDIDGRAVAAIGSLELQKSGFTRLQTYKKIRELWLQREALVSRLRVLGFGNSSRAPYDIKLIFRKMAQIKAELLIYINAGNGKFAKLTVERITEKLGKHGFVMTRNKQDADIYINGTVTVEPVELPGKDFEFARARATFSIVDAVTGQTVGKVNKSKRAGHLKYSEAANKAVSKVSKSITEKLVEYFSE